MLQKMTPWNISMDTINNQLLSLPTPSFICDDKEFARGVEGFRQALMTIADSCAIGYSVKTNSLPYALKMARSHGCMAEVVSHDEYRLARLCGFTPGEIIYNGPMKSRETFIEAVCGGAVVNLEAKRELEWLKELPGDRNYSIGVRLNINISHISPEDADGEDDNSRFGFSDESDELAKAIEYIESLQNVTLAGLHIHRTAHSRAPRFYERSIEYAATVIEKYGLSLDYLDVGGGYFGIFPNKPTFRDYADAFHAPLKRHGLGGLRIIIEPGNALTASSFAFMSEVIDVKRVDGNTYFVTTDGSRNDIDPFFRKTGYIRDIIYRDEPRAIEPHQIVTGCTCLEYDRLFTLDDVPQLHPGDRILYHNVGAYTMTLSPQFIRLWPAVYALHADGTYTRVRRASCAEDIMATDL